MSNKVIQVEGVLFGDEPLAQMMDNSLGLALVQSIAESDKVGIAKFPLQISEGVLNLMNGPTDLSFSHNEVMMESVEGNAIQISAGELKVLYDAKTGDRID